MVCGKCSSHNTPLVYDDNRMNRVCDKCFYLLREEDDPSEPLRRVSTYTSHHHGILEYSLDSHTESPGSNLTIAAALLSFSKAIYPHCCSRSRCINGDPVGCDRLLCLNLPAPLSQAAIPGKECSLGSGNCAL